MFFKKVLVVCFLISEALGRMLRRRSAEGGGLGSLWSTWVAKPLETNIAKPLGRFLNTCTMDRKVELLNLF